MALPVGDAVKDSVLFAPLTYYKLTVPVVALPRSLNDDATRIGSQFLKWSHAAAPTFSRPGIYLVLWNARLDCEKCRRKV